MTVPEKEKQEAQLSIEKNRPYRLRPKPSVRFPIMKKKQFFRGDTVSRTLC